MLVGFKAHTTQAAEQALLARVGARSLGGVKKLRIALVGVPAASANAILHRLSSSLLVAYAERDGSVHAAAVTVDDPLLNNAYWQIANPGLPDAWSLSTGSAGTVVAVLDSGVARGQEDLGTLVPGYNFVAGNQNTADDNGHGTAVAGIIAAQGGNGKGVAGVCWKCSIMPVKVLGADNSGSWDDVAAGVVWATDHGASVINMSLGLPSGSQSIAKAVSYAEARGVVVVASAGNENSSARDYPAGYPGVISVGAVDEKGERYSISNGNTFAGKEWGSNYGSWVQVDAPGCVNSTWPASSAHPGGAYVYFCGTSASAPFVSGLAGLARSYVPSASAVEIAQAIETTARQTADQNSAHGLIDAPAALQTLSALPPGSTVSMVASVVSGKAPLKVSFANTSTKPGPYSWTSETAARRQRNRPATNTTGPGSTRRPSPAPTGRAPRRGSRCSRAPAERSR